MSIKNPFVISGYGDTETFCDRKEETKRMISLLENGNNVVLSAPRRIGKTDLIKHVFNQPEIKDKFFTANVDIYATKSLADFVLFLGKAIYDGLKPSGKKIVDKFLAFLQSLRTVFTFDANGMPIWSLGIGKTFPFDTTLEEIFKYIEESPTECIIAIDEFQQIARYQNGEQVEALLRTYIQRCKNARFIFSGSHRHMMTEMFMSPARPFYMSAAMLNLPLIPKNVYTDFCVDLFQKADKTLHPDTVHTVYDRFQGITAYMQRLMNELFSSTPTFGICQPESVYKAVKTILDEANDSFEILYYQLTERQRATMMAIALNDGVANATSSEFVKGYNLVSGSSVKSSINTLLERDLLTRHNDSYEIYDKFFQLWLLRRFGD